MIYRQKLYLWRSFWKFLQETFPWQCVSSHIWNQHFKKCLRVNIHSSCQKCTPQSLIRPTIKFSSVILQADVKSVKWTLIDFYLLVNNALCTFRKGAYFFSCFGGTACQFWPVSISANTILQDVFMLGVWHN